MGNRVSIQIHELTVKKESANEQFSETNNSSGSSSRSSDESCVTYSDFHDCPQSPQLSPPELLEYELNNREERTLFPSQREDCFCVSIFQKQRNPLRLFNEETKMDYDDEDDGNNRCWSLRTSIARPLTRSMSQKSSYQRISSCSDTAWRNESKSKDNRLTGRESEPLPCTNDSEHDSLDSDTDSEHEHTTSCAPSNIHKKSSSSKVSDPVTITSSPSALEASSRRFYHCYPMASSSTSFSLSKCKTAMSGTASGVALFLDDGFQNITSSNDWEYTQEELDMVDGDEPTEESNLRPPRKYWIVTTAALPWMTGTAVNPLLRAAYLSQRNRRIMSHQQQQQNVFSSDESSDEDSASNVSSTVTLALPWLTDPSDRQKLYGMEWASSDKTYEDQEAYIRHWLATSARMPLEAAVPSQGGIAIQWYPARYHETLSSIFALGDLCEMIPASNTNDDSSDENETSIRQKSDMICILEEPEHVNFYRAPGRESWRDRFGHVIGIVHTNYRAYARNHYSGIVTGPLVGALSSLMVRAYCDKVVKLSPVLQTYAPGKEVVSNVHGIRQEFFHVPMLSNNSPSQVKCYYIGKLLWAKGLDKLLDLEAHYRKKTGTYFEIDIVGSGPEQVEIQRSFLGKQQKRIEDHERNSPLSANKSEAKSISHWRYFRQPIPARFLGRRDHAEVGSNYSVFVNPSITEVLCTTTAEAIAMGKWVIIPRHASNEFFLQFVNCLQYKTKSEFVELLQYAMSNPVDKVLEGINPAIANGESVDRLTLFDQLTWESATDRLIDCAYLSKREARRRDRLTLHKEDRSIQEWHYTLGNGKSGDVLRKVLGGGPVAEQSMYKKLGSDISLSTTAGSLVLTAA